MRISKLRNMSKSLFWGDRPLPEDSEMKGVIETDTGRTGILLKLKNGMYVLGTAGTLTKLNQENQWESLSLQPEIRAFLNRMG